MRVVKFTRNTSDEALAFISQGATEVKPMFGRKAFMLEIKIQPKKEPANERQRTR